jgi:hypothetical protein
MLLTFGLILGFSVVFMVGVLSVFRDLIVRISHQPGLPVDGHGERDKSLGSDERQPPPSALNTAI